ncbi:MAG: segregation/condensation protein A [Ignavibacteriales bacterium]|nr:segregation/condensation protein A [Ignavibacteriales bacterium]
MYNVRLQDFEGPLDLLLFFIKRDELDIYNIPIARITREFMEYLHFMRDLDLEVAGDFVVVAAELMQIKVKMLLPPEPSEEEEEDPRANLVQRLVEYKRFKEVALEMSKQEDEQRKIFSRGYHASDERISVDETAEDMMRDVTLFDLIASFKFAMDRMPRKFVHEILKMNVSIDQQIEYITDFFSRRSEATFFDLIKHMTEKIYVVVTFIALLELIRAKKLILRQAEPFGEVSIMRSVH